MAKTIETEVDRRSAILNSFLQTPHRKIAELDPIHVTAIQRDPAFYVHLAVWYMTTKGNEIRDHKILFVSHLITADFPDFREAGWVLLQSLAPYEVVRVVDHCKAVLHKSPRVLKTAVERYLRFREVDTAKFDRAALRQHEALKHLYATFRIRPSGRADATLFKENPPKDSPVFAVRQLSKEKSDGARAMIITDNSIPYPVAIGAINDKAISPVLWSALIGVMTPQEVVNSLAALEKRGAMKSSEVKKLIETKLEAAKTDSRVSTFKGQRAGSNAKVQEIMGTQLDSMMDARVANGRRIQKATAIFCDRSGSMSKAIAMAKEASALASALMADGVPLYVYAFDTEAVKVSPEQHGHKPPFTKSEWEQAFSRITPGGATALGAGLKKMIALHESVEQIVLFTDEEENTPPLLGDTMKLYAAKIGIMPDLIVVDVENPDRYDREKDSFRMNLKQNGVSPTLLDASKSDYYSMANLIPLLTGGGKQEFVDEVMAVSIPTRSGFAVALG